MLAEKAFDIQAVSQLVKRSWVLRLRGAAGGWGQGELISGEHRKLPSPLLSHRGVESVTSELLCLLTPLCRLQYVCAEHACVHLFICVLHSAFLGRPTCIPLLSAVAMSHCCLSPQK